MSNSLRTHSWQNVLCRQHLLYKPRRRLADDAGGIPDYQEVQPDPPAKASAPDPLPAPLEKHGNKTVITDGGVEA